MTTQGLHLTSAPAVKQGMIIKRPPREVFQAFVDPEITTKFWFTKSTGKLAPGAEVQWIWEPFDADATVLVKEIETDSRIVVEWGDGTDFTTLTWRFVPVPDDSTYVEIEETGMTGNGDEVAFYATNSVGGFTMVLCAAKALLEHGVVLTAVLDHRPDCP